MRPKRTPTSSENAAHRLFLRFFLCFFAAAPVGWLAAKHGVWDADPGSMGQIGLTFVLLALAGGISLLARPYLLGLCVARAICATAFLYRVTAWTQLKALNVLQWNLCFWLTVLSLVLFTAVAARAALFSFLCTKRDTRLLFSREMGAYLLSTLLPLVLSLTLYLVWPRLCAAMGLCPVPLN